MPRDPFPDDGGTWDAAPLPVLAAVVLALWPTIFWLAVASYVFGGNRMTLFTIALAIGCIAFAALWLDERLNRQTAQRSAEFWRARALGAEAVEVREDK